MGLDFHSAQFLASEKRRGVHFGRLLTLGRQSVHMTAPLYRACLQTVGIVAPKRVDYADDFFFGLGTTVLDSMDASNYEGANVIRDLNEPLEAELFAAYDCVFDGGALEHVFNFPIALKNCMEVVKVGGHLIIITPWNNYAGHGFYQFSPELFYNALSAPNGFALERALFVHRKQWYTVADPEALGRRIELMTAEPTLLFLSARRIQRARIFATWPQQSDYRTMWNHAPAAGSAFLPGHRFKDAVVRQIPLLAALQARWRAYKHRRECSPSNRKYFQPVRLEVD